MKKVLNIMTWILTIIMILTACMVDSESLVPTTLCLISALALAGTCYLRQLC